MRGLTFAVVCPIIVYLYQANGQNLADDELAQWERATVSGKKFWILIRGSKVLHIEEIPGKVGARVYL